MKLLNKNTVIVLLLAIICFGSGMFINASLREDDKQQQLIDQSLKCYSLPIPEYVYFANQKISLKEFDVKERFDRELLTNVYWQSQTILLLKRANRFFPTIEKILKEQEAEIKRLEMTGIDGPAQRTRSKARPTTNPVLEELRLEAYHTTMVIMQLQRKEQQIRNGTTRVPDGYRDYGEFLKGVPGWDMERMGYVTRFRPPGYENYDKLKSKSKSRAK